ncbi:restriction endonuclease subunit S [Salmonella enterica]|nr:restriction endonuclease subunit S [Salmonella enterica]EDJ1925282.1 restriction endonuclease subunit S [Salmonella enterica]EFT3405302.1 restriction endonuclease subunit S [Salmonella enterica]EGA9899598.1 restriction endonuclease subunit S [Salmonella enterica]EHK1330081.1 restriction endonuclease subunit S [Salmonella enterica]
MSWPMVKLGEVLTFTRGITFKPEEKIEASHPDAVVCMRTKNIQKELDESDLIAVPKALVKREELFLRHGDILISSANSWNLVGKVVQVPKLDYQATAGGFISILRPVLDKVLPDYLYLFINSEQVQHDIRLLGKQTTNISNLDRKRFLELEIPLPPISIQERIAEILMQGGALLKQSIQMESELNAMAQAVFLEMFGDPVNNPQAWPKVTLGDIAEVQGGLQVTGKRSTLPLEVDYLRVANVYKNELKLDEIKTMRVTQAELDRTSLKVGDMLVVEGHGNKDEIGRTAVWDGSIENCTHQNHLIRVRFDEDVVAPEFVSRFINSEGGRAQINKICNTTSGLNTISANNVRSLKIPLPPIQMQRKFISFLNKLNLQARTNLEIKMQNKMILESLMQNAFSGKLDLKKNPDQ